MHTGLMALVVSHQAAKVDSLHMAVEASRQQEDIGNLHPHLLFLRFPSCLLKPLRPNLVVQDEIWMELAAHMLRMSKSG